MSYAVVNDAGRVWSLPMAELMVQQLAVVAATALAGAMVADRLARWCDRRGERAEAGLPIPTLRSSWLVGGLVAGMLLGPGVLGRAAPGVYEHLIGGAAGRVIEWDQTELARSEARQALVASGVTEAAVEEFDAATQRALDDADAAITKHRLAATQARATLLEWLGAIWLGAMACAALRARPRGFWTDAAASGSAAAIIITAGSLLAVWLLGTRLTGGDSEPIASAMVGLAIAGLAVAQPVSGTLVRRNGDRSTKRDGLAVLHMAGLVMTIVAVGAAAVWSGWSVGGATEATGSTAAIHAASLTVGQLLLATLIGLGLQQMRKRSGHDLRCALAAALVFCPAWFGGIDLLVTGLCVGITLGLAGPGRGWADANPPDEERDDSNPASATVRWLNLVSPAIAMLVALQVDWLAGFDWLAVLVMLILLGDVRWLGYVVGVRLIYRPWSVGMLDGMTLIPPGPTLLILAGLLHHHRLLSDPALTAVLLTALLIHLLAPPTLWVMNSLFDDGGTADSA